MGALHPHYGTNGLHFECVGLVACPVRPQQGEVGRERGGRRKLSKRFQIRFLPVQSIHAYTQKSCTKSGKRKSKPPPPPSAGRPASAIRSRSGQSHNQAIRTKWSMEESSGNNNSRRRRRRRRRRLRLDFLSCPGRPQPDLGGVTRFWAAAYVREKDIERHTCIATPLLLLPLLRG